MRLSGAKVSGQLSLQDAVLSNTTGPALSADGLALDGNMYLDGSFQDSGEGGDGVVRLLGAKPGYLDVSVKALVSGREFAPRTLYTHGQCYSMQAIVFVVRSTPQSKPLQETVTESDYGCERQHSDAGTKAHFEKQLTEKLRHME